ncbi:transposase [Actinokineospora sp. G85]|uniref:transposase n=1 Tax=Actinokineospora sp. G85 TaxID=3406626 RepID=UPI003C75F1D8
MIDPLLPDPGCTQGRGGRWEKHCRRQVVDAIFYVTDNGIKWRALPADFPAWSTVFTRFQSWAVRCGRRADGRGQRPCPPARRPRGGTLGSGDRLPITARGAKPSAVIPEAGTPGRRSTAAHATSPLTPSACCWPSW